MLLHQSSRSGTAPGVESLRLNLLLIYNAVTRLSRATAAEQAPRQRPAPVRGHHPKGDGAVVPVDVPLYDRSSYQISNLRGGGGMTEDEDRGAGREMVLVGGLLVVFVVAIGALIYLAVS
ncbi:hypothetical protein Aau02nite_25010 [Amorphoplanes auranticolor]|uniref:Uncharacterized protein n=1 Tax=Actinoplanes auranticolor TaxID=47988 RepID=A0A919S8V7_9ACTN|nr:hypothetical protein Aau02nite_25010 [Actinoplanes auranticolor]